MTLTEVILSPFSPSESDIRRVDSLVVLIGDFIEQEWRQDLSPSSFDFSLEGAHECLSGEKLDRAQLAELRKRFPHWNIVEHGVILHFTFPANKKHAGPLAIHFSD